MTVSDLCQILTVSIGFAALAVKIAETRRK
jgi:hypothetical protein